MSSTNVPDEDDDFVTVVMAEGAEELEFPKEESGIVLLKTLHLQFPQAIGLKYKRPTGVWIDIENTEGSLLPPEGGWGETVYVITFPDNYYGENGELKFKRKKTKRKAPNPSGRALSITGINKETTSDQLRDHLEAKFGKLSLCRVTRHLETGESRGYGVVKFVSDAAAIAAITCQDNVLCGNRLRIEVQIEKPMKLHVSCLPRNITEYDLKRYFFQFGDVIDVHIPIRGRSGGYGFVTMASCHLARKIASTGTHYFIDKYIKVQISEHKSNKRPKVSNDKSISSTDNLNSTNISDNSPLIQNGQRSEEAIKGKRVLLPPVVSREGDGFSCYSNGGYYWGESIGK